mgnify:CR=1 FL=1
MLQGRRLPLCQKINNKMATQRPVTPEARVTITLDEIAGKSGIRFEIPLHLQVGDIETLAKITHQATMQLKKMADQKRVALN